MENVTFIIKTFERFYCVKRLVDSILRRYPDARILIADDSVKSCKSYFNRKKYRERVMVFELDCDSGLSAGRNYLVDRVETEYFVLLDDDFVFDEKTDIEKSAKIIRENDLDILGGYIRNYTEVHGLLSFFKYLVQRIIKYEKADNYIGKLSYEKESKTLKVDITNTQFPSYIETEILPNFFIAKTNVIKYRNRWDDDLKLQEHTSFFYSAKNNGLRVAFSNVFSVQHKPIKPKSYYSFRGRNFINIFMEKSDIRRIVMTFENKDDVNIQYEMSQFNPQ